jgi:nitrite reductase/ring-hydroxylating ferredoxin subunit
MEISMFQGFANVWTVVGTAKSLGTKKPMPLQIAKERIVLFRDKEGKPVALLDQCPHRGVKLSLGKVKDGCIECPFHGWRFGRDGENCGVPWNPDAKLENLGVVSVPVREAGGLLWVYTAPVKNPPSEPEVPAALLRDDVVISETKIVWRTHWTRAMENMLDWPHLPFVHQSTIGRELVSRRDGKMEIEWAETSFGAHSTISINGVPKPGALDYRFPNAMNLFISESARIFQMLVACVPIDESSTQMILLTIRNFLRLRIFNPLFNFSNRKIASEDKEVVESSFPVEVPAAGEEKSVRTDAPTLKFRKIYRERLKNSEVHQANQRKLFAV